MAIGELKTRLRAKFSRRHSTASSLSQSSADGEPTPATPTPTPTPSRKVPRSLRSRHSQRPGSTFDGAVIDEKDSPLHGVLEDEATGPKNEVVGWPDESPGIKLAETSSDLREAASRTTSAKPLQDNLDDQKHDSSSTTADFPTPNTDIPAVREEDEENEGRAEEGIIDSQVLATSTGSINTPSTQRPAGLSRRQSLLPHQQTRLIKTLLETELPPHSGATNLDYFTANGPSTISANMVSRKIWVKRPQQSATLVQIHEDDLVDDVRDMILKKYANSLGRNFDAPDVTLRIIPREQRQERTLGPEEPMTRTLDAYYPGGQTVDEALIIDVPLRRTPKPSPQPQRAYYDESRPAEGGSDYFPPMPIPTAPSPQLSGIVTGVNGQPNAHHPTLTSHSMSVLTTGHVPALPSPGSNRRHHPRDRPRIGRQHLLSDCNWQHYPGSDLEQWYATLPSSPPLANSLERLRNLQPPTNGTSSAYSTSSSTIRWPPDPARCYSTSTSLFSSTHCTSKENQEGKRRSSIATHWYAQRCRPSNQCSHRRRQHHQPEAPGSLYEASKSALANSYERPGSGKQMACRRVPSSSHGYSAPDHEWFRGYEGDPETGEG